MHYKCRSFTVGIQITVFLQRKVFLYLGASIICLAHYFTAENMIPKMLIKLITELSLHISLQIEVTQGNGLVQLLGSCGF